MYDTMARKFILIDHSIVDVGGHHFEYALHVLRAAERAGYKPILATNHACKVVANMPWELYPIYTYGLWLRLAEPRWYRWHKTLWHRLKTWLFKLKCRLIFSSLGLFWVIRNELPAYISRQIWNTKIFGTLLAAVPFLYIINVFRTFKGLIAAVLPARGYFRNLICKIRSFFKAVCYPFFLLVHPKDWMLKLMFDQFRMRSFGRETQKLFRKIPLEEGDIVFLPTLSEVEMLGLLLYFQKEPRSTRAVWHLLFRRNIYNGRKDDYLSQDEGQRQRRNAFRHFKESLTGQEVYFWTDTEELTDQYNRLGVVPFRTLPIPHTESPKHHIRQETYPLKVVYLGDARAEKGYHHLPRIVGDLWAEYVQTNKAIFIIQSNFNVPEGEPEAVIARAQLESFPSEKVQLIYEPLPSQRYRELLLSADIIVLPYTPDNYYARSSGILVEALSAGIPVIVPAGTWMARQFLEETYRYHQALRTMMEIVKSGQGVQLCQSSRKYSKKKTGASDEKAKCSLSVPPRATHLFLSWPFLRKYEYVRVHITQLDVRGVTLSSTTVLAEKGRSSVPSVLVPLVKNVSKIRLATSRMMYLENVQIDFLAARESTTSYPIGVVGVTYSSLDTLADALREVIDHYAHYRTSAEAFAHKFFRYHNAQRVIEELSRVGS